MPGVFANLKSRIPGHIPLIVRSPGGGHLVIACSDFAFIASSDWNKASTESNLKTLRFASDQKCDKI
jgi:hypothetical protein